MKIRSALRASRSAFTLLEVLVVVAIIVMLAGVGSYYVMQRFEDAKLTTAKTGADKISQQLETYKLNYESFPATLGELTQKGANGGPYLREDELLDPWKKPYQYDPNGPKNNGYKPDVYTNAPNGSVIGNFK